MASSDSVPTGDKMQRSGILVVLSLESPAPTWNVPKSCTAERSCAHGVPRLSSPESGSNYVRRTGSKMRELAARGQDVIVQVV
jgi:hypothetical protein